MHTTIEKINGISDITNDDSTLWFIMYTNTELMFYGKHIGQLTSGNNNVSIECTTTKEEMLERINELGFIIEVDNAE